VAEGDSGGPTYAISSDGEGFLININSEFAGAINLPASTVNCDMDKDGTDEPFGAGPHQMGIAGYEIEDESSYVIGF
jgi:hypothetical protein